MLTADEISRAVSGSLRLLNRDAEGFGSFEVSLPAFWRSFSAVLLTAPAFVTLIAFDRLELGLAPEDGLFAEGWIVLREALALAAGWIAFPLLMILVVRRLGLGARYVGYIIAYNWSAVIASTILALPTALYVLGLATIGLAQLYALAFGVVIVHYRWFMTKTALGVSSGLAALIVLLDLGVNALISTALAIA